MENDDNTHDPILLAAITCHEVNRTFCENTFDYSQKCWDEAPEWQKESAIKGVEFVRDNPDAPPSANHDSWLEEKRNTGWVYGPVKDSEAKTNPCLLPYSELPDSEKEYDRKTALETLKLIIQLGYSIDKR